MRSWRLPLSATRLLLPALLVILTYGTLSPGILGLYHDDGVYAVVAKSFAEGGEYRIESVPGRPVQTKYPPAYSLLLSVMWRAAPAFPAKILWLKLLNLGFMLVALAASGRLGRRAWPREPAIGWMLLVALVGTNPIVVGFADQTMSDLMLAALVTWVLARNAGAGVSPTRTDEAATCALVIAAVLTRNAGIGLGLALVLAHAAGGRWRRAALYAGVSAASFGAWLSWAALNRDAIGNPLIEYYVAYEGSALTRLWSDPVQALRIVGDNLRYQWGSLAFAIGPAWLWLGPVYAACGAWGMRTLVRSGRALPVAFAAVYLPVVLVHPFPSYRYLLPLVPVLYLAVLSGSAAVAEALTRGVVPRVGRWVPRLMTAVVAGTLLAGNGAWLHHQFRLKQAGEVRAWYGLAMGYRFEGFQETFDWVRRCTPDSARLGSIFDPMYFLYTGRQAVRPWLHGPETYFFPYADPRPFVGRPETVAAALRALQVDYVVLDPPVSYAEGPAAIAMLRELIRLPEVEGELVFRSSDGLHEVHRLSWGRGPEPGCR